MSVLRIFLAAPIALGLAAATFFPTISEAKSRKLYKQCKGNHFHWSKEMTANSKKAAKIKAVRDWASFTGIEYGDKWINFRIANKQSIKCETAGIGKWTCVASAIPCRLTNGPTTASLR